jgi:hypothetical protein
MFIPNNVNLLSYLEYKIRFVAAVPFSLALSSVMTTLIGMEGASYGTQEGYLKVDLDGDGLNV